MTNAWSAAAMYAGSNSKSTNSRKSREPKRSGDLEVTGRSLFSQAQFRPSDRGEMRRLFERAGHEVCQVSTEESNWQRVFSESNERVIIRKHLREHRQISLIVEGLDRGLYRPRESASDWMGPFCRGGAGADN
jgi:hypothetical protein